MKLQTHKNIILIFAIVLVVAGCGGVNEKFELQNGDLLFTGSELQNKTIGLSSAINSVTQTELQTDYTHMGIVEKDGINIMVIHAEPEKGVCREPLGDFMNANGRDVIAVYRLNQEYNYLIPDAIENAKKYIGQPYDFTYLLNDSSQYCSGLIYRIFDDLFQLNPMTFKNPQTNEFLPFWIEHYKKLNIEIPENIPGCNPNGMASSNCISRQGYLKNIK